MICANLCNWSLYFHWKLLYIETYCATLCKIGEKFPCASFLSPRTFTDGCSQVLLFYWCLLMRGGFLIWEVYYFLLASLERLCIVQTIALANFLIGASLGVQCTHLIWSEWENYFTGKTFSCAQPNKGLQWVHKQTIFIGASLGGHNYSEYM